MAPSFVSDRDWTFEVTPDELWSAMVETDRYPSWWPWLRRFDPGEGFETGARWHCEVAPPLPYVVRFSVTLDRIEHGSSARATVDGDVRGDALRLLHVATQRFRKRYAVEFARWQRDQFLGQREHVQRFALFHAAARPAVVLVPVDLLVVHRDEPRIQ